MNKRQRYILAGMILLLLPLAVFSAETEEADDEVAPTNFTGHLDHWHAWIFEKLNGYTEHTDNLFAQEGNEIKRVTNSTFSMEIDFELSEEGDPGVKFSPSISADLYIPNIEERLHIFIDNISPEEMPNSDPMQRDTDIYIGARRTFENLPLDISAGVKWRWPPIPYGEATIKKKFESEGRRNWMIYPKQQFFWFADDGFGEKTSMVMDKWGGDKVIARSVSALKWTETTEGLEWSQSITLGYLAKEEGSDIVRGIGTRVVVTGHKSGAGIVDEYRYEILTRVPLYKRWIYLSMTPRVEWTNDNDWDFNPSILFTMNFLFQGGKDR